MATITANFTIDSTEANKNRDYDVTWRNNEADLVTTFPTGTWIKSVNLIFNEGLHRVDGYDNHSFQVCLEAGDGGTYEPIWSNKAYISSKGGDGTCNLGTISLAYTQGKTLAQKGVSDLRIYNTDASDLYVSSGSTATATFTYEDCPTITEFESLSASSQTQAGETTVSWSSCAGSGGNGDVTYELKKGSVSLYKGDKTKCIIEVGKIGYVKDTKLTIYANYSGEKVSKSINVTFYKPSMSSPVLSISQTSGMQTTLTWTAAKLSYTSGNIQYSIYKDGKELIPNATSPYTFSQDVVSTWGDQAVTLTVKATATITGNKDSGETIEKDSDAVEFTYNFTVSRCTAPTSVTLTSHLSYDSVQLSWEGASDGTENAITGYNIRSAESKDGITWNAWSDPVFISSSPAYVYPPNIPGDYCKFCIETCGSAGEDYYSEEWAESETLRKDISPSYAQFTDPGLYAGTTKPKAVHMTELHGLINALHEFNKDETVKFSEITSKRTSLLNWKDHVIELRLATDELVPSHDAWIDIPNGLPSAAVITQIRNILLNYYNER